MRVCVCVLCCTPSFSLVVFLVCSPPDLKGDDAFPLFLDGCWLDCFNPQSILLVGTILSLDPFVVVSYTGIESNCASGNRARAACFSQWTTH